MVYRHRGDILLKTLPCDRSLSASQESSQFLAGDHLPEQVLRSLLAKTKLSGCVGVVNFSPYDSWLEGVALKWLKKSGNATIMPTLSPTKNLTVVSYCERSFALQMMQDIIQINL